MLLTDRGCLRGHPRRLDDSAATRCHFGQPKIQNLGVTALSDEDIGRLYVTVDNSPRMGCIESISDLDGQRQQRLCL